MVIYQITKQEEIRTGILHGFLLEGQHCVTFSTRVGHTESLSFAGYPTQHEALLEYALFANRDIYKRLAM